MDFKKIEAPRNTQTFDREALDRETNNIYEAISILGKRANQVSTEMKEELLAKLSEFATNNDSLEEVFENKEQIEVSRFYERLPKPSLIAIQEAMDNKIYFRNPDSNSESEVK